MRFKRFLSLAVAVMIASSNVTEQLSAFADSSIPVAEYNSVTDESVEIRGLNSNSFGSMISDEFNNRNSAESKKDFAVNRISMTDDNQAVVDITAAAYCKVIVGLYSNDSSETLYASAEQYANKGQSTVTVSFDVQTMPRYYIVKAMIVSPVDDVPLSEVYVDDSRSKEWSEFNRKTVNDFDSSLVYNFDDDYTNNFVVFKSNVLRVEGTDTVNTLVETEALPDGSVKYTFSNCDDVMKRIYTGMMLSYMTEDRWIMVKATHIVSGDKYVITGEKVKIEDIFSFVKLNVDMEAFVQYTLGQNNESVHEVSAVTYDSAQPDSAAAPEPDFVVSGEPAGEVLTGVVE